MTGEHALEILAVLDSHGVTASIDGGWGVDALVGRQTRPHEDLDLVVALRDVEAIEAALAPLGYSFAEDQLPVRFVMRDSSGSQLDFHTVTFDAQGGGVQPQPGGGSFRYPPEGFVRVTSRERRSPASQPGFRFCVTSATSPAPRTCTTCSCSVVTST